MLKTHKTQKIPVAAGFGKRSLASACLFALGLTSGAAAMTPEADMALENLRRRVASGEMGEGDYDRFLESLEAGSGCEDWAREPEWRNVPEAEAAVREACPELTAATAGRLRLSASQAVYPRRDRMAPPLLGTQARLPAGEPYPIAASADIVWRNWRPLRRVLSLRLSPASRGLTLLAGHLLPAFAPARLDFVAGRRFFAGWSGASGPVDGPMASDYAALDGLGGWYRGRKGGLGAFATWNRLEAATVAGRASGTRRDASVYGLAGILRFRGWEGRAQAVKQTFETVRQDAAAVGTIEESEAVDVAGAEITRGKARVGVAISVLERAGGESQRKGAFLHLRLGHMDNDADTEDENKSESEPAPVTSPASYVTDAWQALGGWANPLSDAKALRRDTAGETLILPGRGEGGFEVRSRFAAWETGALRSAVAAGGGAAWSITGAGLLDVEGRLALTQALGRWTHETGAEWGHRARGTVSHRRRPAWGNTLAWRGPPWRGALSLWRTGTGREELALTLGRRGGGSQWQAEWSTDDPFHMGRMRLGCGQLWTLGAGAALTQSLRLPWASTGFRGDVSYRVGLAWSGF